MCKLIADGKLSKRGPDSWKAPDWHADYGSSEYELEALRAFALALLDAQPQITAKLNCFEDGYMAAEFSLDGRLIAELHVVTSDDYIYGLFSPDGSKELYFNKLETGIEYFDDQFWLNRPQSGGN